MLTKVNIYRAHHKEQLDIAAKISNVLTMWRSPSAHRVQLVQCQLDSTQTAGGVRRAHAQVRAALVQAGGMQLAVDELTCRMDPEHTAVESSRVSVSYVLPTHRNQLATLRTQRRTASTPEQTLYIVCRDPSLLFRASDPQSDTDASQRSQCFCPLHPHTVTLPLQAKYHLPKRTAGWIRWWSHQSLCAMHIPEHAARPGRAARDAR